MFSGFATCWHSPNYLVILITSVYCTYVDTCISDTSLTFAHAHAYTYTCVYTFIRDALEKKDYTQLADLMKENFSTRRYFIITLALILYVSFIVIEKFMVMVLLEKIILKW